MKMSKNLYMLVLIITLMIPLVVLSGEIKISALPTSNVAVVGQQITVPMVLDLSNLSERLGSYTAELSWDAGILKYVSYRGGSSEGFTNPIVNTNKTLQGKINFAAANPTGAGGQVNILNVEFEVIGSAGSSSALDLKFTAMASAQSFINLLPYVETVTAVEQRLQVRELPKEFALLQNYPNPFNPTTRISYQLPQGEQVSLWIFNTLGQKVRTLVNETKAAGSYDVYWDGKDDTGKEMSAGIYIYKIQAGSFTAMKKMQFIK